MAINISEKLTSNTSTSDTVIASYIFSRAVCWCGEETDVIVSYLFKFS